MARAVSPVVTVQAVVGVQKLPLELTEKEEMAP
jgi:hypothetical protein